MRNPDLPRRPWPSAFFDHGHTLLLLVLAAFGLPFCATALAQQAPLTGQMMDGQTAAPTHATAATAPQPAPRPSTTQATATPPGGNHYVRWQPHPSAATANATQTTAATVPTPTAPPAPPAPPVPPVPAAPATPTATAVEQAPMPAYTNLDTSSVATAASAQPPAPFGTPIGGATIALLHMQASNAHASHNLTTLGPEATAAWKRYIASFNYPIPKFLKQTVKSSSGGGSQ